MNQEKCAAIRSYIESKFPGCNIEDSDDFNLKTLTVTIQVGSSLRLLKVDKDFIDDNDISEILRQFDLWDLSEILLEEKELGVMITQQGPSFFSR